MSKISNGTIYKELIKIDVDADNKEEIIDDMIQSAKNVGLLSEIESFKEAVLNREKEVPTAIGYKVAIPHGKSDVVLRPFIGFVRVNRDFVWTKKYKETVRLVFLIGVPSENKNNIHLKFISTLSKKLLDDKFRNLLINARNKEEVYLLLTQLNEDTV